MILQSSHVVVDCPICGRPLEMEWQPVYHEIACGHCRGEFTVYETDDGFLTAANRKGMDLLTRAEELLRATGHIEAPVADRRCRWPLSSALISGHKGLLDDHGLSPLEEAECKAELLPTAVLVEHRDEVFARIATDMAEFGMRVVRAKSATEALKLCGACEPVLVVANVDLPDQSGWLLAGKMRFIDQRICVWLYQTQSSSYDLAMVNFLNVKALLDYQGDLLGLSETIVALMANRRESHNATNDFDNNKEPAAMPPAS